MSELFRIKKETIDEIGSAVKELANISDTQYFGELGDTIRDLKGTAIADKVFEGETFVGAEGKQTGSFTIVEELTEEDKLLSELEGLLSQKLSEDPIRRQEKSVLITKNSTIDITPDDKHLLSKVTVSTSVNLTNLMYDQSGNNMHLMAMREIGYQEGKPLTFVSGFDKLLFSTKTLNTLPYTFETTIQVPSLVGAMDQYWGNLICCYNSKSMYDGFLWDVREDNGTKKIETRFLVIKYETDGRYVEYIARFVGALEQVRGQKAHLALTLDQKNNKMNLYVNGVLWATDPVITKSNTPATMENLISLYTSLNPLNMPSLTIGGDWREKIPKEEGKEWYTVWGVDNYRFFRGGIYTACGFSTVRTAEEVLKDKDKFSHTSTGLVFSYDVAGSDVIASAGLEYRLNQDGVSYSVGLGSCTDTDVVIPRYHEGLPVNSIYRNGFYLKDGAKYNSLSIPNTLTFIEEGGIYNMDTGIYPGFKSNNLYIDCTLADWASGRITIQSHYDTIWGVSDNIYFKGEKINKAYTVIPSTVTRIAKCTFCEFGQGTIVIPSSVTSISGDAFSNDTNEQTEIIFLGRTPPTISSNAFGYDLNKITIRVPKDALEIYKNETNWILYSDIIFPQEV